jgi:glyoxylase-like metal-dependent hydrolase (beta-lactamase superfamily II)
MAVRLKIWKTKSGYEIFRILSGRSNVFLLTNGTKNVLIDTSISHHWNKLLRCLNNLGVTHIDLLVLTHTHFDHAGNAWKIKEKYQAPVIVHRCEASFLESGTMIIPNGTNIVTKALINALGKLVEPKLNYKPCKFDVLTDEKFELSEFGFQAYILHTPGHSNGSLSVIVDHEIALVGDAMFGVFKNSIFPPYAEDVPQMIKSWGKLLDTNCSVFLPSHGSANSRQLVQKEYQKRLKQN